MAAVPSPWVQTVPDAMPWGTYPATSTTEVMRFSAGDAPRWAVNERRFRKRHLPSPLGTKFPPRKLTITEEKIAAQLSDLSLDGLVPCCGGSASCEEQHPMAAGQEERRLHVLCPDLEPSPEPLLPRPLLEELRKRTSMAVVLWQPPMGPPGREEATELLTGGKRQEEEDASMEELPDCGPAHGNEESKAYTGHI